MQIVTKRRASRAWLILPLLLAATGAGAAKQSPGTTQAEIQVALCSEPDDVISALGLTPRDALRETWLFDDAALTLFNHGVRVRLRTTEAGSELTLKVAVDDCANVPATLLPAKTGKCEHDMHGDKVTAAVSLSTGLYESTAKRLVSGHLTLADALNAAQVRYLTEVAKLWPLPSDIRPLGPIQVLTYRGREQPYDVDSSRLPGGERYVEVSRKVRLADADAARKRFDEDLERSGLEVCADQSAQAANKLRALVRASPDVNANSRRIAP